MQTLTIHCLVQALTAHYCPAVRTLAGSFQSSFADMKVRKFNVEDFVEESYETVFETELTAKVCLNAWHVCSNASDVKAWCRKWTAYIASLTASICGFILVMHSFMTMMQFLRHVISCREYNSRRASHVFTMQQSTHCMLI